MQLRLCLWQYKKHYKDADDESARHSLFTVAKSRVSELNKLNGKGGPAFGINWMSDRYPHEGYKKGLRKPKDFKPTAPVLEEEPMRKPASINWRDTEAVTAIKNQGQCGRQESTRGISRALRANVCHQLPPAATPPPAWRRASLGPWGCAAAGPSRPRRRSSRR
jgi:hypothetical protein